MLETQLEAPVALFEDPSDGVDLLGKAVHRMRNLMMSVRGYAELIAEGEADAAQCQAWSSKIVQQIDRLEALQTRVDVVRRVSLPRASHSMAMVARAAAERSRSRLIGVAGRIEVKLEIVEDVFVLADGEDLAEAIAALIDNAREAAAASPEHGVVRMNLGRDASGHWCLRVTDNGGGMAGITSARVGEPFFTRKAGHMGLGLYLSRTLLERHDLSLELVHAAEGGTVAIIRERRTPSGGIR